MGTQWISIELANGHRITLTEDNARLYLFGEGYTRYNHVYVEPAKDGTGMFIFRNQVLMDGMFQSGLYSYTFQPTPPQSDREAYWAFVKTNKLTRSEISEFSKASDEAIWQELEA